MRNIVFSVMGGAVGAALVLAAHQVLSPAPTFASVDLQGLLMQRVAAAGKANTSPDDQKQDAARYAQALDASLDEVGRSEHAVLLVTSAVLRGAPDVTDQVRQRIDQKRAAASITTKGGVATP